MVLRRFLGHGLVQTWRPLVPLQKMKRDLVAQEECVLKLNRGLKDTEHSCSAVQNNFQEYCPDLPRQKREVQLLNDRYHAVADQLDQR